VCDLPILRAHRSRDSYDGERTVGIDENNLRTRTCGVRWRAWRRCGARACGDVWRSIHFLQRFFTKYLTTTEYSIDPARSHPSAVRDGNKRVQKNAIYAMRWRDGALAVDARAIRKMCARARNAVSSASYASVTRRRGAASMTPTPTVILDLDGTLINTEQLVDEVVGAVVRDLTKGALATSTIHDALERVRGMRPMDATRELISRLSLDIAPEALLAATSPLLNARWGEVQLMPGAMRLLQHLRAKGVRFGLATSTPREYFALKMASHTRVVEMMSCEITGDLVVRGKPDPEIFELAAKTLGADATACVVIEDTPVGCEAGQSAGMRTIAVPSIRDRAAFESCADAVIHSLYDLDLAKFGLPAFEDWLPLDDGSADAVLPIAPVVMRGPVVKGFGRGAKELGIPTANLDVAALKFQVDSLAPGIYLGFAKLRGEIYQQVMSIGWNPFFDNAKKTIEPWLLHDFGDDGDFYGEELELVVSAYLRPEADFTTLEALITRIHRDAEVAKTMLQREELKHTVKLLH